MEADNRARDKLLVEMKREDASRLLVITNDIVKNAPADSAVSAQENYKNVNVANNYSRYHEVRKNEQKVDSDRVPIKRE